MKCVVGTLVGAILAVATIVVIAEATAADVAGVTPESAQPPTPPPERLVTVQPRAPRYSMLQMNLCLSGFASCFQRHPSVVKEAIGVIRTQSVDAVTFNEACSHDVARIARETGYHVRFAPVRHDGRPLPCVKPRGRGVFGNAVMTRQAITGTSQDEFTAQTGTEERRWICVDTAVDVHICSSHLSTRDSAAARRANAGQCDEFAAILAARHRRGLLMAAGDFNRRSACAPDGVWTQSDTHASQLPGMQHGYGGAPRLQPLRPRLLPARHTDHDFLLIRARLAPPTGRT